MSLHSVGIPRLIALDDDVWTSGQPSPEQLRRASQAGLRSIINLCAVGECGWDEAAVAKAAGLHYTSIPVGGPGDVSETTGRRLHDALASLPHPVLVHCASGNRVGALFALRARFVHDMAPDEALAHGRKAGLAALEGVVSRLVR